MPGQRVIRLGGRPHRPDVHAPVSDHEPGDLPCVHRPELFYAVRPRDIEAAKTLCADCPARPGCLAGALERREPAGVWGGKLLRHGAIAA